ncbi:hypothetical protein [Thiomicrospira cyclica]|uniref:Helix-hairpin-helix DNA-binding, class 1 n=1 Tax=Thiomicrospira cyclica (strain DSM 14477 / JCM 11371 / ALM1) TaxID=717773 RepID=F6DBR6_THICA|nr:hypothetical protein [Thiomicrospira cyclica]AEG31302.1 helix-hairpin-helix DNA-binding, class 1 [Thiomicrospira cyclica ALM1]
MTNLTNLGRKDQDGRQVRIEHRTRYTRASRTGGVSLRAQTKAAGLNITGNTKHGLRVSRRVAKGTQVAMQNGRLVVRGRYGKGPNKLNLSKTGVTVSTKNKLGTFNWIKPNRSSAKLFGVQVRGKKAAQLQMAYGVAMLLYHTMLFAANLLILVVNLAVYLLKATWTGLVQLSGFLQSLPARLEQRQRHQQSRQLEQRITQLAPQIHEQIGQWLPVQQQAALLWIILAWGRGESELAAIADSLQTLKADADAAILHPALTVIDQVYEATNAITQDFDPQKPLKDELALAGLLAQQLNAPSSQLDYVEWLLTLDEQLVANGITPLQQRLLDVVMDFADIGLVAPNT